MDSIPRPGGGGPQAVRSAAPCLQQGAGRVRSIALFHYFTQYSLIPEGFTPHTPRCRPAHRIQPSMLVSCWCQLASIFLISPRSFPRCHKMPSRCLQDASKMPPRCPRCLKMPPRCLQDGPRCFQDAHMIPPRRPKMLPRQPKTAQDTPKTPQDTQKCYQNIIKTQ